VTPGLNEAAVERTTAATDALLGAVVMVGLVWLRARVPPSFRRSLWTWGLSLFAVAALLGVIAHGLALDAATRALLWQPLFLTLGSALAFFSAGAIGDLRGDAAARRALPPLLALAVAFYLLTRLSGGKFIVFVVFEVAALVLALVIYARLAASGRPGAALMVTGLVLSLLGGVLQASTLSLRLIWEFNHNGLYHLVQLAGVICLVAGLRGTLASPVADARPRTGSA
jgi:hypothetical protein